MNWDDLGKSLLGLAPTLAGALFGPLGGVAGKVLADTLGTEATPTAVNEAIKNNPEALAKIKEAEIEWAKTTATIAQANAQQSGSINATMQAEINTGVSWWHWRHLIGYVVMLYGLVILAGMATAMWLAKPTIGDLVALIGAITVIFTSLCALLGYVAQDTTKRGVVAATGQAPDTILSGLIKALTGKK